MSTWEGFRTLLFLLVTAVSCQDAQKNPEIISPLEIKSDKIGGEATLRCNYRNKWDSSQVQWIKINPRKPLILSLGSRAVVEIETKYPGKYQIQESTDEDVYISVLTIRDLVISDSGRYRCVVRTREIPSPKFWAKKEGLLDILEPPVITTLVSNVGLANQRILVGPDVDVTISCSAAGKPEPSVQWWRTDRISGREKMEKGDELRFDNLTLVDTGTYMCIAENGIEPFANMSVFVGMKTKELKCSKPTLDLANCISPQDEKLEIDFQIEGFPLSTVKWYKDSVEVAKIMPGTESDSDSRLNLAERESQEFDWNTHFYRLTVYNVTAEDAGSYHYTASNKDISCISYFNLTDICPDTGSQKPDPGNAGKSVVASSPINIFAVIAFFAFLQQ